jgi:hypothetical protein
MKQYKRNNELKVGQLVTTEFFANESKVVRMVDAIYEAKTCESGYKIRIKNLICECCNQQIGTPFYSDVDSNWANPI